MVNIPPLPPIPAPMSNREVITTVTIAGPGAVAIVELVRRSLLEFGGRFDGPVWRFQDLRAQIETK